MAASAFMMASPSWVKRRPRPVAAMAAPAASASWGCSPGMNFRVARFTNALCRAKSLSLWLRAAARKIERPRVTKRLSLSDFVLRGADGRLDRVHCLTFDEPGYGEKDEGKRLGPENRIA